MIDDLPVSVALPAPLDAEVVAWVEGDLGWQVVDAGGSLAPVLALADAPQGGDPWIAIVDGVPGDVAVTALLTAGAEDVVGWPDDRERIPLIATRIDVHRRVAPRGARLEIAGVAGGVGTSTLALALGGLLAWGGAAALVVGGDGMLALVGDAGRRAGGGTHVAVDGVPRLSVAGRHGATAPAAWSGDVVVVDAGTRVTPSTTLVVARPDGALRRAARGDHPVVVNGDRPVVAADVRRLLGRPPIAHLPWSARVARAAVAGRVPSALPGRWLRDLGDGLRRVDGWAR
ncbi:MAG TPA: hypothetical protein VFZ70_18400 [Euzebyales bacterium]